MIGGDLVQCHEADIVPVACVFRTGISKTDEEEHLEPSLLMGCEGIYAKSGQPSPPLPQ